MELRLRSKKITFFTAAFALILFLAAFAASFGQANPIKFVHDSLPNGLQVIYQIDKSAPVVATVMHYRVGSRDEAPDQRGYAHFFEHLMFEATDKIPRATIDKYVMGAGGELNAHTSFDETVFYIQVPSNEIKLPLWIESQRMRKLLVDTAGVETQRGVVLEEMKQRRENSPYGSLLDKMCYNIFAGGSYEWIPIGSAENIRKATIQNFREFYDNFYCPNNVTLVIAGDFKLEDAKEYVKQYFGIYPRRPEPKRNKFTFKPIVKEVAEDVDDPKIQLKGVFIGYQGPKKGDKDYYAVSLLADILASGESSRLYQTLIDQQQVAVNTSLITLPLEYSGLYVYYGIVAPGKDPEKVEKLIFEQIDNIVKKGISDEEFQKAKNIKEAQSVEGKKNVLEKAETLAEFYSYYRDPNLINTEIERYLKVTKEDIVNAAKKYFDTDKRVSLIYIPEKKD